MNPARSLIVTSTLPSRAHSASTSATTSGAVTTVRMISTSFITGAGLKKCMPTTRLGRDVATEISVTLSEEVFVARIASGLQTRSSSAKICCLRSSCSGTASTTRSTSASASMPTANVHPGQQGVAVRRGELAPGDGPVGRAGRAWPGPARAPRRRSRPRPRRRRCGRTPRRCRRPWCRGRPRPTVLNSRATPRS